MCQKLFDEYLTREHFEIEGYIHELSILTIENDNRSNFINKFDMLTKCIKSHFSKEEEDLLMIQNNNNTAHRVHHAIFRNKLFNFKKQLIESNNSKIHMLAQIQYWLINHSENYNENDAI
ncbi:MAG: hypothetical protein COA79_07770 [Planctomycetota bacterium]|nr:MAG: hypothetical protein COA79_07770 [Planctomycetota bacterium]